MLIWCLSETRALLIGKCLLFFRWARLPNSSFNIHLNWKNKQNLCYCLNTFWTSCILTSTQAPAAAASSCATFVCLIRFIFLPRGRPTKAGGWGKPKSIRPALTNTHYRAALWKCKGEKRTPAYHEPEVLKMTTEAKQTKMQKSLKELMHSKRRSERWWWWCWCSGQKILRGSPETWNTPSTMK